MAAQKITLPQFTESCLLLLIGVLLLWKGGKSLESTWIIAAFAVFLPFIGPKDTGVRASTLVFGVLFLMFSIVSQAFTSVANYGWDELIRDAACFLIFLHVARSYGKDFPHRLSRVLTGAAVLACFVGIAVYAYQPVSRFVGTFFDWRFRTDYWPNAWAEFLLLSWPVAAYALRRRPIVLGAVLGLFAGCLFLSYSRAGFLAMIGQLAFLAAFGAVTSVRLRAWPKGETFLRWISVAGVTVLVGFVIFVGSNALRSPRFAVESVSKKATFSAGEGTSSVTERRDFWSAAIAMTKERPLFGWGPYSFRFVQPRYQTAVLATSDHPHNVFLKIAAERGLPALAAFALLLVSVLLPASKALLERKERGDNLPWQPLAITALGGVLLHSLVDYNLQFVAIALPFWVVMGTLAPPIKLKKKTHRTGERAAAILFACVLLWEGAFLATSSLARHAHAKGDDDAAILWYERSSLQLFRRDSDLSLADIHVSRGEADPARASIRRAIALNPEDARAWLMLGNLQESQKEWDAALAAYERAWKLGKYNILNTLSGLLRIETARAQNADLRERKQEFVSVFDAYADAILMNTHFIALSGTVEELAHASPYLQRAYPDQAVRIREKTAEALAHADEERARLGKRPPGLLW
jgi:O-antigen ligase